MSTLVKKNLHRLIDDLPDDATVDDLMRKLYVVECIEDGLEAAGKGQVMEVKDVRKRNNRGSIQNNISCAS